MNPIDLGKESRRHVIMGRWPYSNRRTTNACKSITVHFFNKNGFLDGGLHWAKLSWTRGGMNIGDVDFEVSTHRGVGYIRLEYTLRDSNTGEEIYLNDKVKLVSTLCYFGGRRWWFLCPMSVNGLTCNRRVGVLYLGGGMYFGCRHCYNLTYKSCKEHDKKVDWLRKNPTLLSSYLDSDDPRKNLMALKAAENKYQ